MLAIWKTIHSLPPPLLPLSHSCSLPVSLLSLTLVLSLPPCFPPSFVVSLPPSFVSCLPHSFPVIYFLLCLHTENQSSSVPCLNAPCTDIHLAKIAGFLDEWEIIALDFDITIQQVETIKRDYAQQYELQKRKMLLIWKDKLGKAATYRKLIQNFENIGKKKMVDCIKDEVLGKQGGCVLMSFSIGLNDFMIVIHGQVTPTKNSLHQLSITVYSVLPNTIHSSVNNCS